MNQSSWKSVFIGSAMALASQTALANKSLPCPTDSPLVDTVWIVQGNTKQKVENRLRAIDSQKHHQVVVVTVNTIEEYGYGSIEEMANAIGMGCKVWYRWENTGVVVLYTKTPSLYRIENAWTERYITDADSKRALAHSKADWVCEKKDVSCRLDDITGEIDRLIRKEFPDQQAVQPLKESMKKFDEQKASQESQKFFNDFALNTVIVVVLWGSVGGIVLWGRALVRRNKRLVLKKQIFELSIRFKTEKIKYPEWFWNHHAREAKQAMDRLENYSDNELDAIVVSWERGIAHKYNRDILTVTEAIPTFIKEFEEIIQKVGIKKIEVVNGVNDITRIQRSLQGAGFIFQTIQIPAVYEWSDPDETLALYDGALVTVQESMNRLNGISAFYDSIEWLDIKIQKEYILRKNELTKAITEYATIYWSKNSVNVSILENQVTEFIRKFWSAYQKKDINGLTMLSKQAESLLSSIKTLIESIQQDIQWYKEIPSKISSRQKQIWWVPIKPEYKKEADEYAQKTGKKTFVGYDMWTTIAILQQLLLSIDQDHSQKKNLWEIDKKFKEFDVEYAKLQEYIWLGATLTAIITAEIAAEVARWEKKRRDEQQRKDEEEGRRRRQEEEEDDKRRQRDEESSRSSIPDWNPGGGSGFDGGGATSD